MSLIVYRYDSYKRFISEWLEKVGGRGSLGELAQAAGCHRTYMSQVLNSKVELTLDHGANLISFYQFDSDEAAYFLNLIAFERAGHEKAKRYFKSRMRELRKKYESVSERVKTPEKDFISPHQDLSEYYSSPHYALIHLATSCDDTQTVHDIVQKYHLKSAHVREVLQYLEKLGLVVEKRGRFLHSGRSLHLNRESHLTKMNHFNWRIEACREVNAPESLHYTNIFSLSKEDWDLLHQKLLDFIEEQSRDIGNSGAEEVVAFTCDLFRP